MANDFLPFAADPAANVMTQAEYADAAFAARLLGFQTGTAASLQLNKVWRQASIVASMLGSFIDTETTLDALDDGTPAGLATLQTNFRLAVHNVAIGSVGTGYLPLTGGTLTGTLNIDATHLSLNSGAGDGWVTLNRQAGRNGVIMGQTNGSARWMLLLPTNTPETGANAGSNLTINRFNDAGQFLGTALSINRASGVVDFASPPTVGGGLMPYVPVAGGVMTGTLGVGGTGVAFSGLGGIWAAHHYALGWDGTWLSAAVDGNAVGQIAMVDWVRANLQGVEGEFAGYLPLTGGALTGPLSIASTLVVDSTIFCRSSVYFANLGDFANFTDGRYRFRQWAGSWYDAWDGQSGLRLWSCYGGTTMQLDAGANLTTSGSMHAAGGRLLSSSVGAPSVSAYSTDGGVCVGFWASPNGLYIGNCDGLGNPIAAHMMIDNNGAMGLWGGLTLGSGGGIYATGAIHTDADLTANGNAAISGTLWLGGLSVSGNMACGLDLNVGGIARINNGSLIVTSPGNSGMTIWSQANGRAFGHWVSTAMMWGSMDGGGQPTQVLGRVAEDGWASSVRIWAPNYQARNAGLTDEELDAIPDARQRFGGELGEELFVDPLALIGALFRRVKQLEQKHVG
jgi:hypothetical protein